MPRRHHLTFHCPDRPWRLSRRTDQEHILLVVVVRAPLRLILPEQPDLQSCARQLPQAFLRPTTWLLRMEGRIKFLEWSAWCTSCARCHSIAEQQ